MRIAVTVLGVLVVVAGGLFALALWLGRVFAGPGEDASTCSRQRTAISAASQLFVYENGRHPTSLDELALAPTDGGYHFTLGPQGEIVPIPGSICDRTR